MCYARRVMVTARTLWRSLLTVVQIATLVAFMVSGAAHAYAGHGHASSVSHSDASKAARPYVLSQRMDPAGGETSAPACGLKCCCQAAAVRCEGWGAAVGWRFEQRLTGHRTVAFASVSSETLPEPPRSFA